MAYLTILASPCFSAAEETLKKNECLSIGRASVVKGNVSHAKTRAIRDALEKGIESYLVRLLGSRTTADHFPKLMREIIPASQEDIENFNILSEQQTDGDYTIFLKLQINEVGISEKLRNADIFLKSATHGIKVLFMVSETRGPVETIWWQNPDEHPALMPIELALHSAFEKRGFIVLNRLMETPPISASDGKSRIDDAMALGKAFDVDVVVFGKCVTLNNELLIHLKALNVHTGDESCEASASEKLPGETPPETDQMLSFMMRCVNRLSSDLGPCILEVTKAAAEPALKPLSVTLTGVREPRQFHMFTDFLKTQMHGIKSVVPTRITHNSMSATVEFKGDRITFISDVLNHQSLPFPLHLGQTDTENIIFSLE